MMHNIKAAILLLQATVSECVWDLHMEKLGMFPYIKQSLDLRRLALFCHFWNTALPLYLKQVALSGVKQMQTTSIPMMQLKLHNPVLTRVIIDENKFCITEYVTV